MIPLKTAASSPAVFPSGGKRLRAQATGLCPLQVALDAKGKFLAAADDYGNVTVIDLARKEVGIIIALLVTPDSLRAPCSQTPSPHWGSRPSLFPIH